MGNLVSLSKVKNYIQPDAGGDDEVLNDLTRFASALIRTYVGRPLTTPTVVEQRPFYFSGRRSIRLDDRLTNATYVAAAYPYDRVLAADEYEVREFPTVSELVLDRAVEGKVLVSGTWGWGTAGIPGDLEYATIVTVDEWYRGNVIPSTATREEGEAEGANIYLPQEVQQMLAPWRPGLLIA